MTHRFSRARASFLALAAAACCLAVLPCEAAGRHSDAQRRPSKAARVSAPKAPTAEPQATATSTAREPTGVWASGEQDRACFRTRRKLWQDGQGWVVKRVSVCP